MQHTHDMQARTPSTLPCSPFFSANTHKQTRPRASTPSQAPPPSARPHACTQQLHSHSTRDASRAKAGIRSRASRAMQHAAPRHSRSAKPLQPSCRIVPSPRRAARRAKAVPTAAVRHSASASPPMRKAAQARQSACPTRPFTACRPCRLVANAVATPLKATKRALAQHPPLSPIKAAQATLHHHAEFAVPPAPSPFFFLASIATSSALKTASSIPSFDTYFVSVL